MAPRIRISLSLAILLAVLLSPAVVVSQVQEGATLTVLRGQVAVLRPDGSAIQPAPSGTVVSPRDEIRTLSATGALITFFAGTEIEMGEQTILVVERVSKQGDRVEVSLKQVFGATLNRVQSFADPGSSYRIEAGGAVAVVRGTEFALVGPTDQGLVVIVCKQDCDARTTFAGCPMAPDLGYWVQTEAGRVVSGCEPFAARGNYFNAAYEGLTTAQQALQGDTRGVPPGQVPAGQQQEMATDLRNRERQGDDSDKIPPPAPIAIPPVPPPAPSPVTGPSGPVSPCGIQTVSGGQGVTTTSHQLGRTSGTFSFQYEAFGIPDQFEVFYQGVRIFTTGGPVSGSASAPIAFGPGAATTVTVTVTGPFLGTAWTYTVGCPS